MQKSILYTFSLAIVGAMACSPVSAQFSNVYSWDGEVSTDISLSANWNDDVNSGDPPFGGGDPALPDNATDLYVGTADPNAVGYAGDPVINSGQTLTASELHLGREFDSTLTLNPGGTLLVAFERFRIGNNRGDGSSVPAGGNGMVGSGSFVMNGGYFRVGDGVAPRDDVTLGEGSHGEWIMNGGLAEVDDGILIDVDESNDDDVANSQSYLEINGGTITTGSNGGAPDRGEFRMSASSSAVMNGGTLNIGKNMQLLLESEFTINDGFIGIPDGFIKVQDTTLVEATLNINGGIIRARNYDITQPFLGKLNINGTGLLQLDLNTAAQINPFITSGDITTSSPAGLEVTTVNIDGNDYLQIGVAGTPGDFDLDGDVDGLDFLKWQRDDGSAAGLAAWQANYGTSTLVANAPVPEPSAFVLLCIAAIPGTCSRRIRQR